MTELNQTQSAAEHMELDLDSFIQNLQHDIAEASELQNHVDRITEKLSGKTTQENAQLLAAYHIIQEGGETMSNHLTDLMLSLSGAVIRMDRELKSTEQNQAHLTQSARLLPGLARIQRAWALSHPTDVETAAGWALAQAVRSRQHRENPEALTQPAKLRGGQSPDRYVTLPCSDEQSTLSMEDAGLYVDALRAALLSIELITQDGVITVEPAWLPAYQRMTLAQRIGHHPQDDPEAQRRSVIREAHHTYSNLHNIRKHTQNDQLTRLAQNIRFLMQEYGIDSAVDYLGRINQTLQAQISEYRQLTQLQEHLGQLKELSSDRGSLNLLRTGTAFLETAHRWIARHEQISGLICPPRPTGNGRAVLPLCQNVPEGTYNRAMRWALHADDAEVYIAGMKFTLALLDEPPALVTGGHDHLLAWKAPGMEQGGEHQAGTGELG